MGAAFVTRAGLRAHPRRGAYLLGVIELALVLPPLAYAAWRLRATLLAGWTGARRAGWSRRCCAIAGLLLLAEALGTFAAFEAWTMIVGSLVDRARRACARRSPFAASRSRGRRRPRRSPRARRCGLPPGRSPWSRRRGWCRPWRASPGGMDHANSLWYHMPLATRFAHGGHFGAIDYFDPIFFASYYPANSEVVHAVGILAFDRDTLSPLINLALAGPGPHLGLRDRPPLRPGAPQSLIGGAIALGAQNLVEFQAGEALNDIVGVAWSSARGHPGQRPGGAPRAAGDGRRRPRGHPEVPARYRRAGTTGTPARTSPAGARNGRVGRRARGGNEAPLPGARRGPWSGS